ncbi:MAG: hypothetical protein MPK06_00280 [Alphaproteobacteria bacterium]|nr:hypothetical protein [Alphaproteobacteria bacterium]MDA8004085.1 hypothetical protein [Alphaproteobacteria bacterium]MDA8004979.1 hypothetical protein [Alphaproteobacteria bacterium]MDA8012966.1 hypothetical protein [Alphaproteobacteria bacterium]
MAELSNDELRELVNSEEVDAFFIYFGSQNEFAERCINSGRMWIGYEEVTHDFMSKTLRDETTEDNQSAISAIKEEIQKHRDLRKESGLFSARSAAPRARQLLQFYTSMTTIWITHWNMRLWWTLTLADTPVHPYSKDMEGLPIDWRWRETTGWRDDSLPEPGSQSKSGDTLYLHRLGWMITLAGGFTIGKIKEDPEGKKSLSYLKNEILGGDAEKGVETLISRLNGGQMEWFVDKLFCEHFGWKRVSAIGSTIKDIDLVAEKNGKLAFIQVKTNSDDPANWIKFARLAYEFQKNRRDETREVIFCFVYHSPEVDLGFETIKHGRKEALKSKRIKEKTRDQYEEDIRLLGEIKRECKIPICTWNRQRLAKEVINHKKLYEWLKDLVG